MAGLYKQPGSSRWTAVFTDATGKQIRRSTKKRDRKEAMSVAVEWENAAKAGREGRLFEAQARKIISEMMEQTTGQALVFYTCRSWFNEWLTGKTGSVGARSLVKYKAVCTDFLDYLAKRADVPLNGIAIQDVRSYRDKLQKAGQSPSNVNQTVRKVLSAPFAAALRLGYVSVNPCAGVEALKDSAEIERDVFTTDQIDTLIETAQGDWKGVILAGYFTGLRLRDITEMRWENVDLAEGVIRIKTAKTGKKVVGFILGKFEEWLRDQPLGIGKAPVFPSLAGKSGAGKSGLSMQFKKIMEKAKIKGRTLREGKGEGRTTSSLSFHSLRHSFNSALHAEGVTQETRMKLTGHSSTKMNDGYTHADLETLRAAVAKLPAIGA